MHRRQPLPRTWLVTDERQGDRLLAAVERLPRGSGILFRHYSLSPRERRALFDAVRAIARRRHIVLLLAGSARHARRWKADGSHGPGRASALRTRSAHNLAEIRAAEREGAAFIFLSPVAATRSHPGARVLGRLRFGLLVRQTGLPVIALGGLSARDARTMRTLGAYGWAGIDAWLA